MSSLATRGWWIRTASSSTRAQPVGSGWCPKANDAKEKCDVCDEVTAQRDEEMSKKPLYMENEKVVMKRKEWITSVIVFAPRVGTHAMQDEVDKASEIAYQIWTDDMLTMVGELAGPDFSHDDW